MAITTASAIPSPTHIHICAVDVIRGDAARSAKPYAPSFAGVPPSGSSSDLLLRRFASNTASTTSAIIARMSNTESRIISHK